MANRLNQARFLRAAHLIDQLPPDVGREVGFCGRSNAGKSSALNQLCMQNSLARTSKTPGRTQQLVYFEVIPERYLVDLPGYGYAKVSKSLKAHWEAFIDEYFRTRQSLVGLVVVMDSRHPLKEYDQQMINFAVSRGVPCLGLLTKADKLTQSEQMRTLAQIKKALEGRADVQLFSATKRTGVDSARHVVQTWLGLEP